MSVPGGRGLSVAAAVRELRAGGPVVIPTDTAYALAADARQATAVRRVQTAKGREAKKPIALLAADVRQVRRFFFLTRDEGELARRFWPGPLTLVLRPRPKRLATRTLSRNGRIGVRVPASAIARRLARLVGAPLTATSANRSGTAACYTVSAALRSLRRQLPFVADGTLPHSPMSTVVVLRDGRPHILRAGAADITKQ